MSRSRRLAGLFGIGILLTVALKTAYAHTNPLSFMSLRWNWMLIALILHVAIYWLGSQGWLCILQEMGVLEQAQDHLANYWISQPFQFLSGVLGSALGRVWLSKPLVVRNKTLVSALLVEKSLIGCSNLLAILTLAILGYALQRRPGLFFTFIGILVLLALAGLGLFYTSTHPRHPSTRSKAKIAVLYLCCFQAYVILALFALTKAIGLSSPLDLTRVARTYIVSWWLGQIAFVIPQGLGIREAIFAFFMHSSAGILWSITFVLWARLLSIGGQLLPLLALGVKNSSDCSPEGELRPYSDVFPHDGIFDRPSRIAKANRIVRIIDHALQKPLNTLQCLDLGCGEGYMTDVFAEHFKTAWGFDSDERMIQRAQQRAGPISNLRFQAGDAGQLPFPDRHFDVVICNQVYEHVLNPESLIEEIRRVLRPDGICYFSAGNRLALFDGHYPWPTLAWWPHAWMDWLRRLTGHPDGYPVRLKSYWALKRLVRKFRIKDYTVDVIKNSTQWSEQDPIPFGRIAHYVPTEVWKAMYPFLPGYLWVLFPTEDR